MNKLSALVFSLTVVVLSAFSTASAQDLRASWLEYENSRNLLIASYAQIDEAWVLADAGWDNGPSASRQQVLDSWVIIRNAWPAVDEARVIVASTLNITLTDTQPRGNTPPTPRGVSRVSRTSGSLPWTPEPTSGSWEELNQAWASIDQAWASTNSAWAELDSAWASIRAGNEAMVSQWTYTDNEWAKLNAAWAAIDAAWNP